MTPQPSAGIPQHIQIELARRELAALKQQRIIAEQGIQALSQVAAELAVVDRGAETPAMQAALSGIIALVSIRLFELQTSHSNILPRIAELESALQVADSGIVIPGMRVKN
jgi:hypothetical protein